jgi:glycosyltransferase involved in cell wall biosynthesis
MAPAAAYPFGHRCADAIEKATRLCDFGAYLTVQFLRCLWATRMSATVSASTISYIRGFMPGGLWMAGLRWAIITGEYPPQIGGISDYTRLVANGLAEAGDEVHVWAPACEGIMPPDQGVLVHRLPGHFGPRALRMLGRDLERLPRPSRILIQYVPQGYGWKGMNLPFAAWLFSQRHKHLWLMCHEVAVAITRDQPLKHNVLGVVTQMMASLAGRAAERCFVAIPEWGALLRRLAPSDKPIHLMPVPSNVPTSADPMLVSELRRQISPDPGAVLLGHFGTFGPHVAPMLADVLSPLLREIPGRKGVLLGRGGKQFERELVKAYPHLKGRIYATGGLPPTQIATHLAACDLLLQPYPDGATSRRGSLMAGLGLGRPIVTTEGRLTEEHWRRAQAVALVPACSVHQMVAAAEALLASPEARDELGTRAAATYEAQFAVANTIRILRQLANTERELGSGAPAG